MLNPVASTFGPVGPSLLRMLLLCLLGSLLPAQVPPGEAEELRRRAQEEAEQRQRREQAPNIRLQEPVPATEDEESLVLPVESPSFPITRLVLELPEDYPARLRAGAASGALGAPFWFAQSYLNRYQGRQVGSEGLNLIVRRLTRRIIRRGYTTTRVGLPEQDLARGTLRVTLFPGIIEAIRFADPALGGTWRTAFPARAGDLLNLRDLEQGLEQMKRLPSQDVDIAIQPGTRPGESEVILSVRRGSPWKILVGGDNAGARATGEWQGNLQLAWDNPLGLSDLFSGSLSHDVTAYRRGSGTRGASLFYSVPMGYWTFTGSWNSYDYVQRFTGYQDFVSNGRSQNLEFRVGYLFYRDQNRKETLQLRTGKRQSRSFLDHTEIEVQHQDTSFVELSLLHLQYLGPAQLDVVASHRRGVPWFGTKVNPIGCEPGGPTFFYQLNTLEATLTVPFAGLCYSATLRGQHTRDQLYGVDYLSLGNRWTVRGFDGEQTLGSECGAFIRNDLVCPLGQRAPALYLGVDVGRVYGSNDPFLPGHSLSGIVLGLKGALGSGGAFDLFLGGALHQPEHFRQHGLVCGISASFRIL
jgi:hemolysin activation/secretion protein